MKICYIANIRLPTEKGHGIQIMKMCEAFAALGHEVTLIVSNRQNPITEDPFTFYNVTKNFSIVRLSSPNLIWLGKIGFWLQSFLFAEVAAWKMRSLRPDAVYSRDFIILFNMFFIHPNLVWEAHQGEDNWMIAILLKKAKLVAITRGLQELYSKYMKNASRTLVAPDAFDPREFTTSLTRGECRQKVGLPADKKIALYWGHLYGWKGVQTLADAAKSFREGELAVVVGGLEKDIAAFREKNSGISQLLILGRKPRSDIAYYLKAADVLVLPNSGKEKISSLYTSPLKLFEDMASGTPIVASDLPSLREILDENTAIFVKPDDTVSLAEGIRKVFDFGQALSKLGTAALEKVRGMTWENRAHDIAQFIAPSTDHEAKN